MARRRPDPINLVGNLAFLAFGGAANLFSIARSLRDESWLCSSNKGNLGPLAAWHTPSFRPLAISLVSRYYLDLLRFDWDEPKNRRNRTKHGV